MLKFSQARMTPQPMYPRLNLVCRFLHFSRRGVDHLRFMDFSVLPGKPGYFAWKVGLIGWWHRRARQKIDQGLAAMPMPLAEGPPSGTSVSV